MLLVRAQARRTAPRTRCFKPCAGCGSKLVLGQITKLAHLQGGRQIPGIGRASDVNFGVEVHETHRFLIEPRSTPAAVQRGFMSENGSDNNTRKKSEMLEKALTCKYFSNAIGDNQTEQTKPITKKQPTVTLSLDDPNTLFSPTPHRKHFHLSTKEQKFFAQIKSGIQ